MRSPFLAAVFALTASAASADEPSNARAAYVERRGLIESDVQCALFVHDVRAALEASAGQARGALLRAGWSRTQVGELEQAVVAVVRARPCNDQRTLTAAEAARTAFTAWEHVGSLDFEGWERTWTARRVAASDGWRLRQDIAAPAQAAFGVREAAAGQRLTLMLPLARGEAPPITARLSMRDPDRSAAPEIALHQRVSSGLSAGAPAPGLAALSFPAARSLESGPRGAAFAVFTFPDTAFSTLLGLDPRESVEIILQGGRTHRLLVEVGDIAAARAFLRIGAR